MKRRGYRFLLLVCLLAALPVWGAGRVLVVGDTNRTYFRSFSASLATNLGGRNIGLSVVDTAKFDSRVIAGGGYLCIVTVGSEAARELSAKSPQVPLLHALVTESFSRDFYASSNGQATHAFLLIDQPVRRLIWLASTSLPHRHRLGVIYGPQSKRYRSEVRRQAESADYSLVEKEISTSDQLGRVMASLEGKTDVLLTLPDQTVVNEETAKTLILGAYLGNLPLVGYSHALVKAGALMSVYTTPDQLGLQAAELIESSFWKDTSHNGMLIYPRDYQVSVNYQVANAMQLELPSEDELKMRLKKMEDSQ